MAREPSRHRHLNRVHARERSRLRVEQLESRITPTAPIPVGTEFPVNSYTTGMQRFSPIGMDAAGDFVIAWDGAGPDDSQGIYAQRFNAAGVPQGGQFRVNTTTAGTQIYPSVAMGADGRFVIAWEGPSSISADDVIVQRFDANGVPQGAEVTVNTTSGIGSAYAKVTVDGAGNFVITWHGNGPADSEGIFARRFNAAGAPQGEEFLVNTITDGQQIFPRIATTADGGFVITWMGAGILARRFNAAGQAYGPEFQVSSYGLAPTIATDSQGRFTIVWGNSDIHGRQFDSLGMPLGDEFLVNTPNTGNDGYPTISMRPQGDFVVTWRSDDVYAQAFNSSGVRQGSEFRVNTYTPDQQERPEMAIRPTGEFVIAWTSYSGDGDSSGVYAQRYRPGVAQIQSTQVNDGSAQRSRVTSLTVTFDSQVTFAGPVGDSFMLVRNGGEPVSFTAMTSVVNGVTVVTLSNFTGTSTEFGSLTDGRYTLTVLASQITDDFGQHLDGNGDLQQGGNYIFSDAQGLFRFYGDVNGDQIVNGLDFGFFRNAFGTQVGDANYLSYLDINGDGVINGFDFGQFRTRFGTMLP